MIRGPRVKFLPIAILVAFVGVLIPGQGIWKALEAVNVLQTLAVSAFALQGDLLYHTQESRHRFHFAVVTSDPRQQVLYIRKAQAADTVVQARIDTLLALDLPKERLRGGTEFQKVWRAYLDIRGEVISLILEGRTNEALELESKLGTNSFEKASGALQAMRQDLESHALAQAGLVRSTFMELFVELAISTLVLIALALVLARKFRTERDNQRTRERENNEHLARIAHLDLEASRSLVLELTGKNEPLQNVLEAACHMVQRQLPGSLAAVSVFCDGRFKEIVSPDLPGDFLERRYALEALGDAVGRDPVNPGSREPQFCLLETAPAWSELRNLAAHHQLVSVWSHPIVSSSDLVLGNLEVYFRAARKADLVEEQVLHGTAQLAAIAINHRHLYEELTFQASRDPLTELPNRRMLHERLEQAIVSAEREGHIVAVLMIDLDRFKQVNDLYGHRAGDALLRTVAQRLTQAIRPFDTAARVGGDEFAVVLNPVPGAAEAEQEARRILDEIHQSFSLGGQRINVTASIGLSLYPSDGQDSAALIRNADLALHQVKHHGRAACHTYSAQLASILRKRMNMGKQLVQALQNREFHIQYQPQVDAQLEIIGVEALLRWVSPEFGSVSPVDFIPLAEESGIIVPIGEWVLQEACKQGFAWQASSLRPLKVAVNVSARQLAEPAFLETVRTALADSGLHPELLELEITESTLMEHVEISLPRLNELRKLGIHFAIDDFGTGYSSLSYLQKLPVSSLKIDKSFVSEIAADSKSGTSLVQAIIELSHGLGLSVVAEGVETDYQMRTLRLLRCDYLQGYLLSRPVPVFEIDELLRNRTAEMLALDRQIRATEPVIAAHYANRFRAIAPAGAPGDSVDSAPID